MFFNEILNMCMVLPPYQHIKGQTNTEQWRVKLTKMQDYLSLYSNAFDYEGFPEDFLKLTGKNRMWLAMKFFAPCVCFFKNEVDGLQCLPVSGMSDYNIAGLPTKWKAFGANGVTYERDETNSVLMFNDYAFSIPFIKLLYDLDLMLECDNTHAQNLKAQRQPLIVEMEEDEKKSASTFISQLDQEVIKVRKRNSQNGKRSNERPYDTHAFESGRAFQGDQLASDYRYFESRILTRLGYNNENLEKRERLLVDEINSNNEVVESFFTTRLECEKEAFDQINKMWGYNIKVIPRKLRTFEKENKNENDTSLSKTKTVEKSNSGLEETNRE